LSKQAAGVTSRPTGSIAPAKCDAPAPPAKYSSQAEESMTFGLPCVRSALTRDRAFCAP